MTRPPLRLGLVGCGRLAELGYAPAARAATGVKIVAVTDPDRARRGLVGAKLEASAHAHVSELLSGAALDGLVVCTPSALHEQTATIAARAGLTALVEKPPAPDAAGAMRIAALTPAPWVAFNRRFDQGLALASRIPSGDGLRLRMVLHYRRKSWRPVQADDDALLDLAPHLIDLALFLTGSQPVAVRASAAREHAGLVLLTTRAEVHIECATNRPHHELIEVGRADGARAARIERGGGVRGALARLTPGAHPLVRALTLQLEAYGRALRGEDSGPLARAGEGAAVMRVLEAARRSDALAGDTVAVAGATSAA
jgi:predicted dehydrogenase